MSKTQAAVYDRRNRSFLARSTSVHRAALEIGHFAWVQAGMPAPQTGFQRG